MTICSENLHVAYGARPVLRGVNLELHAGEFIGLLGPNGSGKSTFLKTLLGYLAPMQGRLVYWDAPHRPGCRELSRRIGFVPQHTGLRGRVTVREAVLMGRLPHVQDRWSGYCDLDHRLTDQTLLELGLTQFAERDLACLSGGELQKVVIARCLAQQGDIILLDEATSGLDLNHAVEIMELMRGKVDRQGKTVVAVLHDLNMAAQYCDRIALLKGGQVGYLGRPETILTAEVVEEIYGIRATIGQDRDGKPYILPRRSASPAANVAGRDLAYVS